MPQFAPITITEDDIGVSGIPDLTFKPMRNQNGVAFYADRACYGPDLGNVSPTLSISNQPPSKGSKLQKCRIKLVLPQPTKDTSGNKLNVKDYESFVDVTFSMPDKSTVAHRTALLYMWLAYLNSQTTALEALVMNGEGIFA